uniref:Amidohydro-rel domain-containing protein n=1 Tax=Trichuris muris TaxID=70415 RepID=A0A5S6R266_TRIMR
MDSAAKDNGKPASAGRSVGDAFFLHVSPHREAAARRFGHLNANGIPTEHPVQMPVKSSSNACFSRLDGSSIYISDGRGASGSTPSLASSRPLFNVVDHSNAEQLSRSWQSKYAEALFYNIADGAVTDSGARLVKARKSRYAPDDGFIERSHAGVRAPSPKEPRKVATVSPWESRQRFRRRADVEAPAAIALSGSQMSQEAVPILLKGGRVINDDSILTADVLIKGGKIAQIGKGIQCSEARVIDVEGKFVIPGGVDPHTHFGFQSAGVKSVDDFATGTKAALAGGTTTIVNCVDSAATAEGLLPLFAKWKEQADSQVYCDYALSVTVPKWSESCKKDMTELVKSHGVNSFKFSTASKGAPMLNDCDLYQAFKHCRQLGALARIHSEHGDLTSLKEEDLLTHEHLSIPEAFLEARPEQLEADCALRACSVSKLAGCPLDLVFVVNKQVARSVGQLRNKGYFVFGETTTASLGADGNGYFHSNWNQAAAHVTLPPLRPDTTIGKALIRRLASGELQMVSSGHCAFKSDQRTKQASGFGNMPHGVTGVEERMMILWQKGVNTGMLDPMRFVAVTSSNAAKLFNLYPSKGRIAVDSDADVVVWDPNEEKVLPGRSQWSSADYSIYEGTKCTGMPVITIAGGKVVFEEGQVKIPAGSGKFVNAAPFSPLAFSRMMMKTADGAKTSMNHLKVSPQKMVQPNSVCQEFHSRPATKAGGRNMLDSSFALSGAQVDDGQGLGHGQKRQTRVTKPPGGDSHRLW